MDDVTGNVSPRSTKRRRTAAASAETSYAKQSDDGTDPIDTIDSQHISSSHAFYERYVALRKPCVITNRSRNPTAAQEIVKALLSDQKTMVQVERRFSTQERFGQSRSAEQRQVSMSLSSFLRDICHIHADSDGSTGRTDAMTAEEHTASALYYLSTQEPPGAENDDDHDDDDDDDARQQIEAPPPLPYYGPPCDVLHQMNILPSLPLSTLAGNLHLHSVNLWMGYTPPQQSVSVTTSVYRPQHSGLHFDYHDNFYCLLHGEKTFYLYPPNCAPFLMLNGGAIDAIHPNGLISLQHQPIRSDGRRPERSRVNNDKNKNTADVTRNDNTDCGDCEEEDEEEEVILGKGFDYESSNDDNDDGNGWHVNDDDECDDDDDDGKVGDQKNDDGDIPMEEELMLPRNFSWIDPVNSTREQIIQTFPVYTQCPIVFPFKVTLRHNQCLYLPASWLHCVVSSGNSSDNDGSTKNTTTATTINEDHHIPIPAAVHMAINYWYHPPDNLTNHDHPYVDRQYWERPVTTAVATVATTPNENTD